MAQPCSSSFSISIVTAEVPCRMEIESDDQSHSIDVDDVLDGTTVTVDFVYEIGNPKRSVFASSYTKSRTGGTSGDPPDLGARSFSKTPDQSLAADEEDDAQFSVVIPAYSGTEETNLGTGSDTYDITLWLREATVRIGGNNPPANLEPPNPA